ncbi:Mitochondrial dicarboxylate transporter [Neonectria magnoliae]|uniref:Mitochondrial dicarboxylate transporter n=1 Tax=Neonectria magnoliae TaxID=2732573 RepID=A0ABR1IF78_9HYPO
MVVILAASSFSGACGTLVRNPGDIANVRVHNDRSLPTVQRQNYRIVVDALARIARQDGLRGYFRSVLFDSIRAAAMTGCQLSLCDGIKEELFANVGLRDDVPTELLVSLLAGLIATTMCSPIDVIKTRTMSQGGKTSILGMARKLTRSEGIWWAFRGWLTGFARLGEQTAATLLLLERHKSVYKRYMCAED